MIKSACWAVRSCGYLRWFLKGKNSNAATKRQISHSGKLREKRNPGLSGASTKHVNKMAIANSPRSRYRVIVRSTGKQGTAFIMRLLVHCFQ